LIRTGGNLKVFLPEDLQRNSLIKVEEKNIRRLSAKVAHIRFDQTPCRRPSATFIVNCR